MLARATSIAILVFFNRKYTVFMDEMKGLPIARATRAVVAQSRVPCQAGFGKI